MYCLDTNIAIDHLRGNVAITKKLLSLQDSGQKIAITAITLCELYKGACISQQAERNLEALDTFLGATKLLTESRESCLTFGRDYGGLRNKGIITQEKDLMIASVCKTAGAILVTKNVRDFKNIPDLLIEAW